VRRPAIIALAVVAVGAGVAAGLGAMGDAAPRTAAADARRAAPAPAPAPARSAPFALVADSASGRAVAALRPGGSAAVTLRLANGADHPRAFLLEGRGPGARPWVSAPARVEVPARQSARVVALLRAPSAAAPGRYAVAVLARPDEARGAGQVAVAYVARARIDALVR
jgi:hypothetical protein